MVNIHQPTQFNFFLFFFAASLSRLPNLCTENQGQ